MKKEINKIIDNLDKCMGVFDYMLTPTESNLLSSYIKELREKNKYLEKTMQKQKEVIDKAIELLNNPWSFESGNKEVDEITYNKKRKVIDILNEVE